MNLTAVELLDTIPGVDKRGAEMLIAEFGVDMSRFDGAERLASWGGMCPGAKPIRPRRGLSASFCIGGVSVLTTAGVGSDLPEWRAQF